MTVTEVAAGSPRARIDALLHPAADTEHDSRRIPPPVFQPSTVMLSTFVVAIIAGAITLLFPEAR